MEHIIFLSEVASHGFLVLPWPNASGRPRGGGSFKSSQLTFAIDWAIAQNNNKDSDFMAKSIFRKCSKWYVMRWFAYTRNAPDPRNHSYYCKSGILGDWWWNARNDWFEKGSFRKICTTQPLLLVA
jgi:hypothetical protein